MNNNVHELQEELRSKKNETEGLKNDIAKREDEKKQLEACVQELEQELKMKAAALQSLMLVKKVYHYFAGCGFERAVIIQIDLFLSFIFF